MAAQCASISFLVWYVNSCSTLSTADSLGQGGEKEACSVACSVAGDPMSG
jgi:hypothetical protein